jgi:hypothetical protein
MERVRRYDTAKMAADDRLYNGHMSLTCVGHTMADVPMAAAYSYVWARGGGGATVNGGGGGGILSSSLYRYRAAVKKQRRGEDDRRRRLQHRSRMNMNKKGNNIATGVVTSHMPRQR